MDFLNRQVFHKRFGQGRIQMQDGKTVTVWFENYGSRTFIYPDAFASFLQSDDEELMEEVSKALARKEAAKAAIPVVKRTVQRETVRKAPARRKNKG